MAASIISSSLIEPPGSIIHLTPASCAASIESLKGKNASLASAAPLTSIPKSSAFRKAALAASTLEVIPIPTATIAESLTYTTQFDLVNDAILYAISISLISCVLAVRVDFNSEFLTSSSSTLSAS